MGAFRLIGILVALLMALGLFGCASGDDDDDHAGDDDDDNDDDNDTGGDDDDDDDDDDNDTAPPLSEPLQWGRYVCGEERADDVTVVVANYNLHNGKEASAAEIAAGLAAWGPFDVLTLQECPEEYGPVIAAELAMDSFIYGGGVLLSATPLVGAESIDLVEGRSILHATTTISGTEFSLYGIHISWNEAGDLQARQLVDEVLANDPTERIVMAGDWNDEIGSTQMSILGEVMADVWSSLGVWPTARISWPAQLFYGSEGAQLIDNTLFNKDSGACAVEGEIVNFTPPLSDHKPQIARLSFPAVAAPQPPRVLDVLTGVGEDTIGLLFDRPMDEVQVELADEYGPLAVAEVTPAGVGEIALVRAAAALPTGVALIARVTAATDVDGNELPATVEREFVVRANLLADGGAEDDGEGWALEAMQTTDDFYQVTPLAGERFFSGDILHKRGWARQTIGLGEVADAVDAGRAWLVFAGASRTGFVMTGTSNMARPYDEGEAQVEMLDGAGRVLRTVSSGRFDTMFWVPWRIVAAVPPGTRAARVTLRAVGGLYGMAFNSASFDALSLTLETAAESHGLLSGNLVANADFDPDLAGWDRRGFVVNGRDRWLMGNFDVSSFAGEYWAGAVPLTPAGMEQEIDLSQYSAAIDAGEIALNWGAALRSLLGDAAGTLTLTFYDAADEELGYDAIGPIRYAEWFPYEATTAAPAGARRAVLSWQTESAEMPIEGAFLDAPFAFAVRAAR